MQIKRSLIAIIAPLLIAALPLAAPAQVAWGVGATFGGPGWGVGISTASYAPPPLPVYAQPAAPYPNYQWIPGYWGWGATGYYWVPGYWTPPPTVGYYWTPGYWGYLNGAYAWNPGYWGPTVGFYGGINYGYGYFGTGFVGGYWSGGVFNYNTAVTRDNRTVIHNVYNKRVVSRTVINHGSRVSYNGGRGGIHARPTRAQVVARRHGIAATRAQRARQLAAARDPRRRAGNQHGRISAAAHHNAVAAHHHNAVAAHHHNAVAANHHNAVAAHHHNAVAANHHNASVASAHHHAPVTHGRSTVAHYGRTSTGGAHYAHQSGRIGSRPAGGAQAHGGYAHGAYGGGGSARGGMFGGRPGGGGPHGGMSGGGGLRGGGGGPRGGGGRPPRG